MSTITQQASVTRLPMPEGLGEEFDVRKWRVLCEATFPSAKSSASIVMAVDYCKARRLDVFKKPVHIVPMWNSSLKREVETVWPGINEVQITASRTGQWAGMDEAKWGPDKSLTFKGRRKTHQGWENAEVTVTFPEACAVTVYRMISGQRCPFTEPVYWLESYSRSGGASSALPTDMWVKRPRGQLHKVAKAASLRAAFPEEGEYTAEEMEGKEIEAGGIVIDHISTPPSTNGSTPKIATPSPIKPAPTIVPDHDPITGEIGPREIPWPEPGNVSQPIAWGGTFVSAIRKAKSLAELDAWEKANFEHLATLNNSHRLVLDRILVNLNDIKTKLYNETPDPEESVLETEVSE